VAGHGHGPRRQDQLRALPGALGDHVEDPWRAPPEGSPEAALCAETAERLRRDEPARVAPPSPPAELAAARFVGRLALERPLLLVDVKDVASALLELPAPFAYADLRAVANAIASALPARPSRPIRGSRRLGEVGASERRYERR
jgi:hypothetical protein